MMAQNKQPQSHSVGGMLTGQAIRQRGVVTNAAEKSWRAASYDLRIGKLINPEGETVDHYSLPPRGIVEVISKERVMVPQDLSGSAMVKTSLCNDGILALGIGLIDPGWDGPISSFLINFGKSPRRLAVDDVFLRTTFHTLEGPRDPFELTSKSDDEIARERQRTTVSLIGGSFLNIEDELERLGRKSAVKRGVELLSYIALVSILLTSLGFILTWFTSNLAGKPQTSTIEISEPLAKEIQSLREENAELRERTEILEARSKGDQNPAMQQGNAQ